MRGIMMLALVALVVAGCSAPPPAPSPHEAIVAKARAVAAGLDTPEKALAAGYRPDPFCIQGQGVHWVHPALLADGLDADHPEMLLFGPADADLADTSGDKLLGVEYYVITEGTPDNASAPSLLGEKLRGPMPGHFLGQAYHADLHVFLAPGVESDATFPSKNPAIVCPPATTPVPSQLAFRGCGETPALFPAPASDASALPSGFKDRPFDPQAASPTSTLFLVPYKCASVAGGLWDDALTREVPFTTGPVTEFLGGLLVVPPEALKGSDVRLYVLPLGLFTDSNATALAYAAWHIAAEITKVSLDIVQDTPAVRVGRAEGASPNLSAVLTTTVHAPSEVEPAGKARIFAVQGQQVVGYVEVSWTPGKNFLQGNAVLQFTTPGTPSPFPPPLEPGIGAHIWGDDYDYDYTWVPVAPAPATNATAAPPRGPLAGMPLLRR